jgi:hypothetical protein
MTTNRETRLRRRLEAIETEIERRMSPTERQVRNATRRSWGPEGQVGELSASERQARLILGEDDADA